MKLKPPAAVIFDMDGLIFDTEALYEEALLQEALAHGARAITQATARQTVGLSWPSTRLLLASLLPPEVETEAFIAEWTQRYDHLASTRLATKPGVRELLDVLDAMSIPSAIATGSKREKVRQHLLSHGLFERFPVIIADEDCSRGKPDPEPFLKAAEALGLEPTECWALEDSVHGVAAAHQAGMTTIMIPDLVEPDAQTVARCGAVLKTLLELPELLPG